MMRPLVSLLCGVLLLAPNAVADTGNSQDASRWPGRYGGALKAPQIGDPHTFNPLVAFENLSKDVTAPLFDSLLRRNPYTLEWESRLAALPQIDERGKIWTFSLRPGLLWSDGQALTADDIIFTVNVIYDESVDSVWRDLMLAEFPDATSEKSTLQPLQYRKLDDSTVQFIFPSPHVMAREMLSFPIVPKHKLEKAYRAGTFAQAWDITTPPREIVSCGPFVLESYERGRRLTYYCNSRFWKKDSWGRPLPYLEKFERRITGSVGSSPALLKQGVIDVAEFQAVDYPSYKARQLAGKYRVLNLGPSWGNSYLAFNQNPASAAARKNPALVRLFRETKFRRAVSHAIQRERIVKQLFAKLAQPRWSPVSPADKMFHNSDVSRYSYNPVESRRLLHELDLRDADGNGYLEQNGQEIRFTIITNIENDFRKALSSMIAEDLRAIGLNAVCKPVTFVQLVTQLDKPDYDWQAVVIGFTSSPEPYEGNNIWLSSGDLHVWYPNQKTPATLWETEIDRIFESVAREYDASKRRELYHRWQVIMAEQLPLIYLPSGDAFAAARPIFGNLRPCSLGGVLWNLEEIFSLRARATSPEKR